MKAKARWGTVAVLVAILALNLTAAEANDFYQGKTIRLIVATTPGGGFDAYSRMLARHMGKHIPGTPVFVVENMPCLDAIVCMGHEARRTRDIAARGSAHVSSIRAVDVFHPAARKAIADHEARWAAAARSLGTAR